MNESLRSKLYDQTSPKRILSLDGGGMRGLITLGMLKAIEDKIRYKENNKALVIGNYYDLICGTSTGAIIGSLLAVGKSVDEITKLYLELGEEIFGQGMRYKFLKRSWKTIRAVLNENYSSSRLETYLQKYLGDIQLGNQDQLLCGLAINSKRADTYSLWTVANHPDGIYYKANAHLKLWELCRASSAAPYYFKPKKLTTKTRAGLAVQAAFIDGGVSLSNNPAWTSLLVATVPKMGFRFKAGSDHILITSLGTGNGQLVEDPDKVETRKALEWAPKLSDLFMVDALEMNLILMKLFGVNAGSDFSIDSLISSKEEIHLIDDNHKLFTYQRFNVTLTDKELNDRLKFNFKPNKIASLMEMDHYENMADLLAIGTKYGEQTIRQVL